MKGYESKLKSKELDALFEAVLSLETVEECYRFFEDLSTVKEVQAMAQRLEIAKLLRQNVKWSDIEEETSASTATISRVSRCLNYGADGYRIILDRLDNQE